MAAAIANYRGSSGVGASGTIDDVVVAYGATDVQLVSVTWNTNASLTPPTGLTAVTGSTTTSSSGVKIWQGYVVGGGAGLSISFSSSVAWSAVVLRVTGASTTSFIDTQVVGTQVYDSVNVTTHQVTGKTRTTTAPNQLLLHAFASRTASTGGSFPYISSWGSITGCTYVGDVFSSGSNINVSLLIATEVKATVGLSTVRYVNAQFSSAERAYGVANILVINNATSSTVLKTIDLQWDIRSKFVKSINLQWSVRTGISKSISLLWTIVPLVGRTPVAKTLNLQWDIRTKFTKTANLLWSALSNGPIPGPDPMDSEGWTVTPKSTTVWVDGGSTAPGYWTEIYPANSNFEEI